MTSFKAFFRLFLVATLAFSSLQTAAQASTKIRFTGAHEPSNTRVMGAIKDFGEAIKKESKGRLELEIVKYENDDNDHFVEAMSDVSSGTAEMSQISTDTLAQYSEDMKALSMPGVFQSHRHVEAVLDGPIGKDLRTALLEGSKKQIRSLAFTYSGGMRELMTKGAIPESGFSGLKAIGTGEAEFKEQLGMELITGTAAKKEAAAALESGKITCEVAHINRLATILSMMSETERKKMTITETHHSFFLTSIVINEKFFQSLPKDLQKIITSEVAKMAASERKISIEQAEENKKLLISQGIKVLPASAKLTSLLQQKALAVQLAHKKTLGKWVSRIKKSASAIKLASQN